MTCDSGAGEESTPPPPPVLRTPSMRLAMVSPTARVVAPGWRARGGGRRRLARPVASPRFGRNGTPAWSAAGERVFISVGVVRAVFGLSQGRPRILALHGARIQKRRAGCRSPSPVRPAVQISQKALRGLQMQRARDTAQVRRRAGTWVVFLLQRINRGTVRRRIWCEPTPDVASEPWGS